MPQLCRNVVANASCSWCWYAFFGRCGDNDTYIHDLYFFYTSSLSFFLYVLLSACSQLYVVDNIYSFDKRARAHFLRTTSTETTRRAGNGNYRLAYVVIKGARHLIANERFHNALSMCLPNICGCGVDVIGIICPCHLCANIAQVDFQLTNIALMHSVPGNSRRLPVSRSRSLFVLAIKSVYISNVHNAYCVAFGLCSEAHVP